MRPYRGPALSATALGLILSLTPFLALAQEKTAEQKKEIIEEQTATGDSQNLGTIVLDGSDRASAETSYLSGTTIGRVETDPKKLPATVSAYAAKRIEEQNIRSNLDLMQGTPGVDVTSNEGFFRVRGFGAQTAVDGISVGSFVGRTSADLSAFEQVEILKGPAALVQGNGSPGGTVNYSFKRPGIEEAFSATMGIGDPTSKIVTLDYNIAPMLNGRLRARFVGSFEDRELFTAPEAIRRSSLYDVTEFDLTERTTIRIGFWQQKNKSNQTFRTGLPTWNDGTLIDFPVETTASQNWNEFNFTARWLNIDIEHEITDGWDAKLPYRRGKSYHPSVYGSMARGGCAGVPGYGSGIDPDNPDGRACYTVEYWSDINEVEAWDGSVTGSFDAFGQTHDLVVGLTHERSWFGREGDQQHLRQLADPEPDDEKRHHRQRGDRMDHADRDVGQPLADMRQALRMASHSPITAPVRTQPAPGTERPPEHPRARHAAQSRPSKPRPSAARRTGYCRTPSSFSPATAGKGQRAG